MARKENPGYDGRCRFRDAAEVRAEIQAGTPAVVRMKVPRGAGDPKAGADASEGPVVITVDDALRKPVEFNTMQVDDQVLLKSDGFPTYHLANIVDDHLMGVTHVMRGEEWLSSTHKHVLLYQSFGWEAPVFAHLPLLRNQDKSKVSKRKNPVSIGYFQEAGYMADAMVNFLGMMAFTFEDGREIFSLADFVENFNLDRISLGGPVFDLKKLLWVNGRYLREKRSDADLVDYLKSHLFSDDYLSSVVKLCKERFEKSEDFIEYAPWFFTGTVDAPPAELVIKGKTPKESKEHFAALAEMVDTCFDWRTETVDALMKTWCEQQNLTPKEGFMPLRWMVSGRKATPPLPESLAVLGRERVRTRIRAGVEALKKLPEPPKAAPSA